MQKLQTRQSGLAFENCTVQITKNEISRLKKNVSCLKEENERIQSEMTDKADKLTLKSKQTKLPSADRIKLQEQNSNFKSQLYSFTSKEKVGFDETSDKNRLVCYTVSLIMLKVRYGLLKRMV